MNWSVLLVGASAVGLFVFGLHRLRRKRLIEDVPTSTVKGVFAGVNEVKGIAGTTTPLTSYLTGTSCVWYRYEVQEEWKRTVTEQDANGQEHQKTETGWTIVASDDVRQPFSLTDQTGALIVRPEGADIDGQLVLNERTQTASALYDKGPPQPINDSTGTRQFKEWVIPLRSAIYVLGPARMAEDASIEIAHDNSSRTYLISTRSEAALSSRYSWQAALSFLGAIVLAFLFPLAVDATSTAMPYISGAVAIVAVVVTYLVLVYNGLVRVRERVKRAWSLIDIQLKRRHDLIPRLVDCVKAYAAHEAKLQEAVALARSAVPGMAVVMPTTAAVRVSAGLIDRQSAALSGIRAVAEAYPELHANEGYLSLQRELVDTEDRIAHARAFFNDSVTAYNDRIGQLPDSLVAVCFGFRNIDAFTIRDFDRPRVATRSPGPSSGERPPGPRPGAGITPRRYEGRPPTDSKLREPRS